MITLAEFIEKWDGNEAEQEAKKTFVRFQKLLQGIKGVELEFVPREGVTYSLRAKHSNQTSKSLFVMVDVIEDSPRWLSVCFYAEMINDPESRGDEVPGGLLGEDALCFDMESCEDGFACMDMGAEGENLTVYLEERLKEAAAAASRG